jgi:hypothetical protein
MKSKASPMMKSLPKVKDEIKSAAIYPRKRFHHVVISSTSLISSANG